MNAVNQSSTHPLVVLERNRWITQDLLDRLSAYSGSIFLVTDLHRCAVALDAQRPTPVLVLAGKPPESHWTDWSAQVKSVIQAPCPLMAVDLPKASTAPSFLTFQGTQDAVDLGDAAVDVTGHIRALIEQDAVTTLAYGPLHLDRSQKVLSAAGRSVALKDALFISVAAVLGPPTADLADRDPAEGPGVSGIDARHRGAQRRPQVTQLPALSGLRRLHRHLPWTWLSVPPPNVSLQDRRMAARSTRRDPLLTDHRFSAPGLGLTSS